MNLQKEFTFEDSKLQLPDGTEVLLLRDAISRVAFQRPAAGKAREVIFLILYELPRCQFVLAEYGPCAEKEERRGLLRTKHGVWHSEGQPRVEAVDPPVAYDLYRTYWYENPLPDSLKEFEAQAIQEASAETEGGRPLEYWEKLKQPTRLEIPAHAAATLDFAVSLFLSLGRFKQLLRTWMGVECFPNLVLVHSLADQLFGGYPVDPAKWPPGKKRPKYVGLSRLPWPGHLKDVGTCFDVIQHVLGAPLRCFVCRLLPHDSPHRPNWDELHTAIAELLSLDQPLEKCLVHLEAAIATAERIEEMRLREREHEALHGAPAKLRRAAGKEPYRPSDLKAYATWRYALKQLQDSCDQVTPRVAYNWLKEHGWESEVLNYELKKYSTWRRQVSRVRDFINATGFDPLGETSSRIPTPEDL